MDLPVSANLEYPSITITERDVHDARVLQDSFGGRQSETTAIMQYAYQSYTLQQRYPALADILRKISVVEMKHHRLLGESIYKLGRQPLIASCSCFWSASAVYYGERAELLLEQDVLDEKRAIASYERAIKQLHSRSLASLIEVIIADEAVHVSTLSRLLKTPSLWIDG